MRDGNQGTRRARLPADQRRQRLLDALLAQITTEGFAAVSMESIARRDGIAKTVVYRAFGDVDGALAALFAREQERALAAVAAALPAPPFAGDPVELAVAGLRALLDDVRARPDSWRLILVPGPGTPPVLRDAIGEHRRRLVGQLHPIVTWALDRVDEPQLDAELLAYTIVAAAEHAARLTLERPTEFDPDRIVAFIEDLAAVITRRLTPTRAPR